MRILLCLCVSACFLVPTLNAQATEYFPFLLDGVSDWRGTTFQSTLFAFNPTTDYIDCKVTVTRSYSPDLGNEIDPRVGITTNFYRMPPKGGAYPIRWWTAARDNFAILSAEWTCSKLGVNVVAEIAEYHNGMATEVTRMNPSPLGYVFNIPYPFVDAFNGLYFWFSIVPVTTNPIPFAVRINLSYEDGGGEERIVNISSSGLLSNFLDRSLFVLPFDRTVMNVRVETVGAGLGGSFPAFTMGGAVFFGYNASHFTGIDSIRVPDNNP